MARLARLALTCAGLAGLATALNPIEVQSQNFVESGSGNRFEIIGVDYQPGGEAGFDPTKGEDPLSNGEICARDAALMQRLGVNTIRVYNLDPYINHDECMSIFDFAGIYAILDVNSPLQGDSINRDDPGPSYNIGYLNRTFAVIDAFRQYDNVIGFFMGNEIINSAQTAEDNPPYIRAVIRDLKRYVDARGGRPLPIGYSAADYRDVLVDTANYLQCTISGETGISSRTDFFALNSYSWCGADATFESSTYNELAADFAASTNPVFFSEFGCIVPAPRAFNEIPVLYGEQMTTWSGGLVYQWTEEGSPEGQGYGLVQIQGDGSVKITPDFNTLQAKYAGLNFTLIESQNVTAQELTPPECSADLLTSGQFSTDFDLPNAPDGTDRLINQGVDAAVVGKFVSVTRTVVNVVVTQVDGSTTDRLTITQASSANRPDGQTYTGGSNPTGSPDSDAADQTDSTSNAAAPTGPVFVGVTSSPVVGFSLASLLLWFLG